MLFGLFTRKNIQLLTDAELLLSIQDGSKKAEGEIFIRYSSLVMGLCLKYLKNVTSAEDMMMNLFEKLPAKIKKSEIDNFKNWLYSVSRNECLMELRKKNLDTADIENSLRYQQDDSEQRLNEIIETDKILTLVENAMKELKLEQKRCLELFYIEGRSYDEISKKLKWDIKKIKSCIQNGKRNMKIILEKQSEFE